MKLQDLLKDIELGKVYTDKNRKPFKVNEGMRRFKVYVSGESEPLVLMGKDIKDVKHIAHQMIQNSSVKIKKVVKEGKLNEVGKFKVSSNPYKAWQEHGDHNEKLFNDAHWAMKAIPHKKKEIKEIQKLSGKLRNLIAVIQGQAMDL